MSSLEEALVLLQMELAGCTRLISWTLGCQNQTQTSGIRFKTESLLMARFIIFLSDKL